MAEGTEGLDLRGRFLFDTSGAKTALDQVSHAAVVGADKVIEEYRRAFEFTKKTIGLVGLGVGIERAVESATKLEQAQAIQAQLLVNTFGQQNAQKNFGLSISKATYESQQKLGNYTSAYYSKTLAAQATYLSVQTGINREQFTQAQTLAYTNNYVSKLVSTGPMLKGSLTSAGQPLHGMRKNMQLFMQDAVNLSSVMSGGQGSVHSSARMLTRVLQDPMHRMSMMTRYGFSLSQSEQMRIRTLEMTNGLYAAQQQMLVDINNHVKSASQVSASPIELLKNDLQIIYTTLGSALLPLFKNLAGSLGTVLTSISPLLQTFGDGLGQVMNEIGTLLAPLMQVVQPIFDLLVNGILPAFFALLTPIIKLVNAVAVPLVNALVAIIEPMNKTGTLTNVFIQLGKAMGTVFAPLVKIVKKLADSGVLNQIFGAFTKILQTLAPILPELTSAFVSILVALLPIVAALTPAFIKVLQAWADIMVTLAPVIVMVANGLASLIKWITGNKGITDAIAMLAAVWFTRKLFLAPISLAIEMLGGLVGKLGTVASTAKGVGTIFGSVFRGGEKGAGILSRYKMAGVVNKEENRSGFLNRIRAMRGLKMQSDKFGERVGKTLEDIGNKREKQIETKIAHYKDHVERGIFTARSTKKLEKWEALKKEGSRFEKLSKGLAPELEAEAKKGGKFSVLKNLLGFGGGLVPSAREDAKDPLTATKNLTIAINNLIATIESSSMGGGGNNVEKKLEGEIKSGAKKEIGKILEGEPGKKLEKRVGGRLVGMAKNFLGRGAAGAGEEALLAGGSEAAAEGGILAAGAASGVATLGIGLAIAGATVAYMKWHKQINHAISSTAHHLANGAKNVAKWGMKTAKDAAKHFVSIGKHLLHGAGALVSGAAHVGGSILHSVGGFFGGLFGGGGGSSHSTDSMAHISQLRKMTFVGGALNVHVDKMSDHARRAMTSENRKHGGASNVVIQKGAFTIEVRGDMDKGVSKQIEKYVEDQFKELHRQLRAIHR